MTLTDLLKEWTAIHEERVGNTMPLQPISDEDLAASEAGHGFTFPDELRELLRYTNGIDRNWTGTPWSYQYFPSSWWNPIDLRQDSDVAGLGEFLGSAHNSSVQPGNPNNVVVGKSAKLLSSSGVEPFGLVLEGSVKGWLWQALEGEPPVWYARSLTELVRDCIEFEQRELLHWDDNGENTGCEVKNGSPRIGFGHFSEGGPADSKPDML